GEFDASSRVAQRSSRIGLFVQYVAWLGYAPMTFLLGVESWLWVGVVFSLALIASAFAYVAARRDPGRTYALPTHTLGFGVFALGAALAGLTSAIIGPLLLVPQLAVTNAIAYVMFGERRHRFAVILLSCAA